ncbi:hypothetical protein SDC9_182108 [bioreactor metagenome]|uniref:Uncharacterized protein n=1 Tax=bioreactor metagenome TaxID=1076179 RepID=A0A645HET3_9ZZZZ
MDESDEAVEYQIVQLIGDLRPDLRRSGLRPDLAGQLADLRRDLHHLTHLIDLLLANLHSQRLVGLLVAHGCCVEPAGRALVDRLQPGVGQQSRDAWIGAGRQHHLVGIGQVRNRPAGGVGVGEHQQPADAPAVDGCLLFGGFGDDHPDCLTEILQRRIADRGDAGPLDGDLGLESAEGPGGRLRHLRRGLGQRP